mmetsp:Transcript_51012/g.122069  ORF Transcript_51012/g.122069 Transcript_51012/m.122069 type:complete len:575 (+) Transcript_51012:73-1797(+)
MRRGVPLFFICLAAADEAKATTSADLSREANSGQFTKSLPAAKFISAGSTAAATSNTSNVGSTATIPAASKASATPSLRSSAGREGNLLGLPGSPASEVAGQGAAVGPVATVAPAVPAAPAAPAAPAVASAHPALVLGAVDGRLGQLKVSQVKRETTVTSVQNASDLAAGVRQTPKSAEPKAEAKAAAALPGAGVVSATPATFARLADAKPGQAQLNVHGQPAVAQRKPGQAAVMPALTGAPSKAQAKSLPVRAKDVRETLRAPNGGTEAAERAAVPVPSVNATAPAYGLEWHSWHVWRIWPQLGGFERLLTGITFMSMLKALCMAGNVLVQITPYPQVQRWEAESCTGDSDAAPYVSIAFGGWQWCYYGLFAFFVTKRSGFLILVHSNCLGALLGTYYSFTFYRNCNHSHSLGALQRYMSAVVMMVVFQLCALPVLPVERALFLTGLISSFCSFIGAISILVSLPRVVQTKDSSPIPLPLVLANLISSLVWCVCGWMLADPLIAAPNIVGCLSCLICVLLKHMYPDDGATKRRDSNRESACLTPASVTSRRHVQARAILKSITYQSCDTGGTM